MYDFLSSILGDYSPVTYEMLSYDPSGEPILNEIIPAGVAGVDWLYVLSGLAFLLCVYCVFRLLGGLICKIS